MPRRARRRAGPRPATATPTDAAADEDAPRATSRRTCSRAAPCSAAATGCYGPIALYGGRIDPGKGCEELIEYFSSYVKEGGDATLALMGVKLMSLPEEPFIRFAGLLSDRERLQALEAATVVVCPSPYESLSLLALEAMSVGTPILANARSAVLVEHCVRSNGGLYYADRDEFVECLKLLVGDDAAARRAGPQRPRLRPPELPVGRRARQVRADLREDQERPVSAVSGSFSSNTGVIGAERRRRRGAARGGPRRRRHRRAAGSLPSPFAVRLRRGRMSYRLIISFSVVGLMCSSSAARFWTPPAASSVDSISRFSKSVMTSLNEMPSGGTTNCGIWKFGALRT